MTYDAIVVGAGVMGLSAALEIGRRGQRVALLDQFPVPHSFGSSHGETRVTRTAYFEHPDYVPLAQRAWDLWQELGPTTLVATGGMYLGRPGSALVAGSVEAALRHGLKYELKKPEDIRRQYPQVSVPDDYVAFVEAQCGILAAAECLSLLRNRAADCGVDVREEVAVSSWQASPQGVSATTRDGKFEAGRLVFCAGPWSGKILSELDIPLTVTRQVVGFTGPAEARLFTAGWLPVMCMESSSGAFYYTIPICLGIGSRSDHFKAARHDPGQVVSPESVERRATSEDEESFLPGLREFLPGAAGPVRAMDICLYTNTPDGHFVVDKHPSHDNVLFACGFSGHGFKFAPVIGEALADLALEGRTELPIGFLRADRFAGRA